MCQCLDEFGDLPIAHEGKNVTGPAEVVKLEELVGGGGARGMASIAQGPRR